MTSTDGLRIYHLIRQIPPGTATYDELLECVVLAESEQHARRLAAGECGDEGTSEWFADSTSVHLLGTAVDGWAARVFCRDVHEA